MAPELRKRKSKGAPEAKSAPKAKDDGSKKRKATEDVPAVREQKRSFKKPTKQKSTKEKPTEEKPTEEKSAKKSAKKSTKKSTKEQPIEEEETVTEETAVVEREESPDSVDYADDVAQQLAADIDGAEEEDEEEQTETTEYAAGDDVGTIPTLSKKDKKAAKNAVGSRSRKTPGVVYVGRIPHGFYEQEMRQYFEQFGPITRLRLSRNKMTGASKHFAFIEFAEDTTAEVVAKTMDNYLLFGHVLKCKLVAPERVHENLWEGANRRFKKVPWNMLAAAQLSRPLPASGWERRKKKERARRSLRAEKLKGLGYEFEAPTLKEVPAVAAIEGEAPAGEITAGEAGEANDAVVEAGA